MLKELVKIKVLPVVSVMVGSMFLASCSSGVSRFDFPMFGLANTNDQTNSTSSLSNGARLGQDMGAPSYRDSRPASSGLAGFGNSDVATPPPGNLNARSSYLPPQTAAPEVRAARYRVIDNSAQPVENSSYGNDNAYDREASSGARSPMKPITEASRSFLPSEPNGYNYNANSARPARRQVVARRSVTKRAPIINERRVARAVSSDGSINVAPGDTLYSIGRRHNVSVMKLMELNDLSDSSLSVGQQIILPKATGARVVTRRATSTRGRMITAASSGTYTVGLGENFQAIARKLGVSSSQLADINGITEPGSIRAGEVLILPTVRKALPRNKRVASLGRQHIGRVESSRGAVVDNSAQDLKVRKVKTRTISLGQEKSAGIAKRKVTSVSKTSRKIRRASKKPSSPRKAKGLAAFRWPVRGRIIGKFGPRPDGTNNDGINLAVPSGTRVKAAEEGIVAYAGSELKGYGKLVLIRHANNWVSAYAHNGKLLVKRGDKIKRGQVVARAGASGSVAQPQVHFELRKGSKPVDPLKYMAGS